MSRWFHPTTRLDQAEIDPKLGWLSCNQTDGCLAIMDETYLVSYRNDLKFSDRQVLVNSADPDQTAVWSASSLFAILSASFGPITL